MMGRFVREEDGKKDTWEGRDRGWSVGCVTGNVHGCGLEFEKQIRSDRKNFSPTVQYHSSQSQLHVDANSTGILI